jgi:hydroxyacylglutathione hydrolase
VQLLALPAFTDNYIWMLHNGRQAVVVDPGDAAPVVAHLKILGLQLAGILVTHHHADHVGGVDALRPYLNDRLSSGPVWGPVFGPANERLPEPVQRVREGNVVQVLGQRFGVLDVPGHTAGHIAYVQLDAAQAPLLFCGDTLFSGGCGRLFEGTPAQMLHSLAKLAALPADTQVCCTHEYTLSNLRFAAAAEPDNAAVAAHTRHCQALREQGLYTLPSSLGLELQINPFLRCTQATVVQSALAQGAKGTEPLAVFTALREWKNRF